LALAALALVVFGAYDSYPLPCLNPFGGSSARESREAGKVTPAMGAAMKGPTYSLRKTGLNMAAIVFIRASPVYRAFGEQHAAEK